MRNKVVKIMRKALKPLVKAGVLHPLHSPSYDDTIETFTRYIGLSPDPQEDGTFMPMFEKVDMLTKRVLMDDCVKFHVKTMKENYKAA